MHLGESHTFQSKFSTFQCKFSSLLVKKMQNLLRSTCFVWTSNQPKIWLMEKKLQISCMQYIWEGTLLEVAEPVHRSQCLATKNILFLTFLRTFTQQHFHTVQNSRFSFLLNIFSKLNLWRPCFAYSSLPVAARGSHDQNG